MPVMTVGGTDARFYRNAGSFAYGFGLMSPDVTYQKFRSRFHGNDERVDVESLRLTTDCWLVVGRGRPRVKPGRPLPGRRVVITQGDRPGGRSRRAVGRARRRTGRGAQRSRSSIRPDGGAALRDAVRGHCRLDRGDVGERSRARARTRCPRTRVLGALRSRRPDDRDRCSSAVASRPRSSRRGSSPRAWSRPSRVVMASRSSRRPQARAVSSPTGSPRRAGTCASVEAYRTAALASDVGGARRRASTATRSCSPRPRPCRSFVSAAGVDGVPPVVVCIGPVTAEAAIDLGVTVTAVPDEHTIPAMVAVLVEVLRP